MQGAVRAALHLSGAALHTRWGLPSAHCWNCSLSCSLPVVGLSELLSACHRLLELLFACFRLLELLSACQKLLEPVRGLLEPVRGLSETGRQN